MVRNYLDSFESPSDEIFKNLTPQQMEYYEAQVTSWMERQPKNPEPWTPIGVYRGLSSDGKNHGIEFVLYARGKQLAWSEYKMHMDAINTLGITSKDINAQHIGQIFVRLLEQNSRTRVNGDIAQILNANRELVSSALQAARAIR